MFRVREAIICPTCGTEKLVPQCWAAMSDAGRERYVEGHAKCRRCAATHHGLSGTKLWSAWKAMRERCGLVKGNAKQRKNHADKGITVCDEWLDFEAFADWAFKNGYKEGLWLDREDNDKGYNPNNCRWVSGKESARNTSRVKLSPEAVIDIRRRKAQGVRTGTLAKEYGVVNQTIRDACNASTWADI